MLRWSHRFVSRYVDRNTHTHTSSSSSCRAISTDIPDPLSPLLPIVYCFQWIFRATSRIGTKLLYVGYNWLSCLFSAMWRGTSLMSSSLLLQQCPLCLVRLISIVFVMVAVQVLLCAAAPGLVQYCSQYSVYNSRWRVIPDFSDVTSQWVIPDFHMCTPDVSICSTSGSIWSTSGMTSGVIDLIKFVNMLTCYM